MIYHRQKDFDIIQVFSSHIGSQKIDPSQKMKRRMDSIM